MSNYHTELGEDVELSVGKPHVSEITYIYDTVIELTTRSLQTKTRYTAAAFDAC